MTAAAPAAAAVEVQGVSRVFKQRGVARAALQDVSFTVPARTTLAVVGESGAGKSTLTRLIAGLDRPSAGTVVVDGRPAAVRRGRVSPVQMVFQNPLGALSPHASIGASIAEPLRHMLPRARRAARVAELLEAVGLDPRRAGDRPRRFSGGQLQRIVLARALAAEPRVLLCDEPTSALDVSVQAQIVNLLLQLQAAHGFACVLVTHDLQVAKVLADDVVVLQGGRVVEHAPAADFFAAPQTEYARTLLGAVGG